MAKVHTTARKKASRCTMPPALEVQTEILEEGKFKVVEVSDEFSGSPLKHVVVVSVEKPQPTVGQ